VDFAGRASGRITSLPADAFYRYGTAIAAIVGDGFLLLIVVVIALRLPVREALALRRPASWRDAAGLGAGVLVFGYAVSIVVSLALPHVVREQEVPAFWDPSRGGAFAANLFAIAVFVPIFEEALCRGLGYALFEPFGAPVAIAVTALAFALAHGAVVDFPVLLVIGLGLGYLRARSGSLYPCIAIHGIFNGVGLLAAAFAGST